MIKNRFDNFEQFVTPKGSPDVICAPPKSDMAGGEVRGSNPVLKADKFYKEGVSRYSKEHACRRASLHNARQVKVQKRLQPSLRKIAKL